MPELPEVETIRRDLAKLVVGRKITAVTVATPSLLRGYSPERLKQRLEGRKITGVQRRAKILIFEFDSGDKLLVHLKMSGRLLYVPADAELAKHTHLIFGLDNGSDLRFVDMRRFGYYKLVEGGVLEDVPELRHLGPEPLAADFSEADFKSLVKAKSGSRRAIKGLLLDQTFLAGVGNLYADEVLYAARINPTRPVGSIRPAEAVRLYHAIREILAEAIESRGTSFDLYVDAQGQPGAYVQKLQVYGRADQACFKCGATLLKTRVAGRGTNYCPGCQK